MINDRKKVTKDRGGSGGFIFFVLLRETIVSPFTSFTSYNGESICVCVCWPISPPSRVYFEICQMLMMSVATKIHNNTHRGTNFLFLTRWDPQWRQHCWHSCGDVHKPTPGLQNEWDPHSWVGVHPHRLWGDTHCLVLVIIYVCVCWQYIITVAQSICQLEYMGHDRELLSSNHCESQCEMFKGIVPKIKLISNCLLS